MDILAHVPQERSSRTWFMLFPHSQRIQDMEEQRVQRLCEAMHLSVEAERKVLPVMSRCLDAMMDAAESVQPRTVSLFTPQM